MATISQKDFDKLVSHTIRIELMDGAVLHYSVTAESKAAFTNQLREDATSKFDNEFVWFHTPHDRLVLVNLVDLSRVTFCFEAREPGKPVYDDNFNIIDKAENSEELEIIEGDEQDFYLPQLILKHRRDMEDSELVTGVTMKTEGYFGNVSAYYSLGEGDVQGFGLNYFENEEELVLQTFKYLNFIDDDGEENFMPLKNISVIEIERQLIMTDELLDILLGNKQKRKTKGKRK